MLLRKTPAYYFQLSRHIIILYKHIHTQGTGNFAEENKSIIIPIKQIHIYIYYTNTYTQVTGNFAEENISIIIPTKKIHIYIYIVNKHI